MENAKGGVGEASHLLLVPQRSVHWKYHAIAIDYIQLTTWNFLFDRSLLSGAGKAQSRPCGQSEGRRGSNSRHSAWGRRFETVASGRLRRRADIRGHRGGKSEQGRVEGGPRANDESSLSGLVWPPACASTGWQWCPPDTVAREALSFAAGKAERAALSGPPRLVLTRRLVYGS
jgi:hypothetical protein